jgi:hypothetical protein
MKPGFRLCGTLCAGLALLCGSAHAALAPRDFAYGATIAVPDTASATASAYRASLPLEVYRGTLRDDLGDLRVFNANDELVPYRLDQVGSEGVVHEPPVALPLFPLRGDVRAATEGLRVTIQASSAGVNVLSAASAPAAEVAIQYILDGRSLDRRVAALVLSWPHSDTDYSGQVRVEASEDLSSWLPVRATAPVANLRYHGLELLENRIELPPTRAKFWRLTWVGASPPFELSAVSAESADHRVERPAATLEVAGNPSGSDGSALEFDLGGRLPVTRVQLALREPNSVVTAELLSRAHPQDPWRPALTASFFRLGTPDGEQVNSPLAVDGHRDRYWLVRIVGPGAAPATAVTRLAVTWVPADLVFLAHGAGPFRIAYGSATAGRGESDLGALPIAGRAARTHIGAQRTLGGAARLAPPPIAFPWLRALLWAILALAVAILAWMAYRLAKDEGAATT